VSDWDKFLESDPDPQATERVMAAVDVELRKNRPTRRKFVWAWLVPAMSVFAGAMLWRFTSKTEHEMSAELLLLVDIDDEVQSEQDMELLENFDMIADLEVLEQWTNS